MLFSALTLFIASAFFRASTFVSVSTHLSASKASFKHCRGHECLWGCEKCTCCWQASYFAKDSGGESYFAKDSGGTLMTHAPLPVFSDNNLSKHFHIFRVFSFFKMLLWPWHSLCQTWPAQSCAQLRAFNLPLKLFTFNLLECVFFISEWIALHF